MKNYGDSDQVKVVKPLRTKITTALGMPNNRISFGGQKRRASENRPNRKQDEIESKEYRHENKEYGLLFYVLF